MPSYAKRQRQCMLYLLLFCSSYLFTLMARAQAVSLPAPEIINDRHGLPQAFIADIVQDNHRFMWIATRDGLCRYDGRTFRIFQPSSNGRPSLSFAGVGLLELDYQGRIWVVSERGDLDLFDPLNETFVNFSNQPAYKQLFGLHPIKSLYFDHHGRLWLAFDGQGLGCLNTHTGKGRLYRHQKGQPNSLRDDRVVGVVENPQEQIWIATTQGLSRFDTAKEHFVPISFGPISGELTGLYIKPGGEFLVSSSRSLTQINPRTGVTRSFPLIKESKHWNPVQFATDSQGVVYLIDNGNTYRFSNQDGLQFRPELNEVQHIEHFQSLWIDCSDVLWLGTIGAGIRKYNLRADPFQTAGYQNPFHIDLLSRWLGIKQGLAPAFVRNTEGIDFRYTLDRQNGLWFTARSTPIQRVDLTTGQLNNIPFPTPNPSEKARTLYLLATDPQGRIWAIHDFQAWWYDGTSARWIRFKYPINIPQPTSIWQMVVDQDAFWLATDHAGLYRVDRHSGQYKQFTYQPSDPTSLSNNNLFCLSTDPTDPNRLWIGTFGSGLCVFDKRTGKSRRLTVADGLPDNVIYSAIPDEQGYVWMGTNKGLVRMNRRTFSIRTFTRDDGLMADEFNRFHYLHLPNGRMLMGGLEGITAFYPKHIKTDQFQPTVELTTIQVNNQPLRLAPDSTSDLSAPPFQPCQVIQHLTLPYNQNFLTVGFAVMQYNKPGKNRFRHQLEGLDQQWVETDRPEAIYTNLSPGRYVLKLNSTNTAGLWSPHIRTLTIIITPPNWATWWAYTLYALILLMVGYGILRSYLRRLTFQQTVRLKEQEARQLRELDEVKSRFFSNITHEFRTPLTLILTPVEQMMRQPRTEEDSRQLGFIHRNASQLLQLIGQLLDLAKIESGVVNVMESPGDLKSYVEELVHSFQPQAELKSITLTYQASLTSLYWFDASKLERIVYNLIANAIKFTSAGGQVEVSLNAADNLVHLTVSDTGIGISSDKLPHIFDRFFQVDDSSTRQQAGTGIGLALVNELVLQQGGTISVDSLLNQGTTFVVTLPYRPVSDSAASYDVVDSVYSYEQSINAVTVDTEGWAESDERPGILIVEDNDEMAQLVASSLPNQYHIHRAKDGLEGWDKALEIEPDLVISDVLMPHKDGYTLCHELKSDPRTSHIPVVLLTAKSALESRLKGLSLGADDYIPKPFHITELQLRLQNLLEGRVRLRAWVNRSLTQLQEQPPAPAPLDPFLETVYRLLDDHLSDTAFGVNELAWEVGMSRASLYRKIKAVSDLPVNELIQNYRLKQATVFLRQGRSVSETAYLVGFETPSYFAKCFRELYQSTPSEFTTLHR